MTKVPPLRAHSSRVAADIRVVVLTWIHLYAFAHTQSTSSAATSVRIYYEYTALQDFLTVSDPAYYRGDVPLGTSTFPHEIIVTPSM